MGWELHIARTEDDFISIERVQHLTTAGKMLSLSWWRVEIVC